MKKKHLIFLVALLLFPQVSLSESLREALAAPTQYIADTFFTATGVSHFYNQRASRSTRRYLCTDFCL